MKRPLLACTVLAAAALLGALPSAQAAPQKPAHQSTHRRVAESNSVCLADQMRIADVIDRYESMSPQMRQTAKRLRTRCLPTYSDPSDWATWPNGG